MKKQSEMQTNSTSCNSDTEEFFGSLIETIFTVCLHFAPHSVIRSFRSLISGHTEKVAGPSEAETTKEEVVQNLFQLQ